MSVPVRIVEVLSSDAPTLDAPLTVTPQYDNSFAAFFSQSERPHQLSVSTSGSLQ